MFLWQRALLSLAMFEAGTQVKEVMERHRLFRQARATCAANQKQLLRIGVRRGPLEPPNGDVTLDIDRAVLGIPGGVCGDERAMPFADKEFGVCFNEHTLEHLENPEDVALAVRECVRVADVAMFLCPSPYSVWSNLFNKTHHLRLWLRDDEIWVTRNTMRLPFLPEPPGAIGNDGSLVGFRQQMGQHLILSGGIPPIRIL